MPYLGQIRRVGPHSHFLKFHCYFIAPVLTMPQNKVSQGCKLGLGGGLRKNLKIGVPETIRKGAFGANTSNKKLD